MARKIKAIVKRPDETWGHACNISNSLQNLQSIVGGPIETLIIPNGVVLICNEEGKLRGLPWNFDVTFHHYINPTDYIETAVPMVGTIIACGIDEEDFGDIPKTFADWKDMLRAWGNN